jgi:hypothetical protein
VNARAPGLILKVNKYIIILQHEWAFAPDKLTDMAFHITT